MTKKIHMIGGAHIDPAWLWHWQDGFAEVKATFRSALDRLAQFPSFLFTCSSPLYLKWVEENEPDMFLEIKRYSDEGRWIMVGGMLIEPDCNAPSGESFARHALYAQGYLQEKFGKTATVGYNIDSFGHNAMLPQLLRLSGMDSYVFMRPADFEMELPSNAFWWESPDKSRVLCYRIPLSYASYWASLPGEPDPLIEKALKIRELAKQENADQMCFYGVCNHGGGPTILNLMTIEGLQRDDPDGAIRLSSPDRYFESIRRDLDGLSRLPVVSAELQHHASGCYAAHLATKKNLRRAENRLLSAEKLAVLAKALCNRETDLSLMKKAWEKVLFNQFHDLLGGCSIRTVYEDVEEFFGFSLTVAAEALNAAVQAISWSIDTTKGRSFPLSRDKDWLLWEKDDLGAPVVIFNPLSWDVETLVTIDKKLAGVSNNAQRAVPHQVVRGPRSDLQNIWDTVFKARIPAFGYRVYWLYCDREFEAEKERPLVWADGLTMENNDVRIEFDRRTGFLKRYTDKKTGRELLSGPSAKPIAIDEYHTDVWGHSTNFFDQEIGQFSDATLTLLETGPVRAKMRVVNRYGASVLQQDFILVNDSPALTVEAKVLWVEHFKMLKLTFSANVTKPRAFYQVPYGMIERPADGEEEPGQQWFSISDESFGLAIMSDSLASFSVRDNTAAVAVIRSPIYAENAGLYLEEAGKHDETCDFMEQGEHFFRYRLLPHGPEDWARVHKEAQELSAIFPVVKETYHKGPLSGEYRGISVTAQNISVGALKKAERRDGMILRLHETAGIPTNCEVNVHLLGRCLPLRFGAQEIKTLYLPADRAAPVEEVNFLE